MSFAKRTDRSYFLTREHGEPQGELGKEDEDACEPTE